MKKWFMPLMAFAVTLALPVQAAENYTYKWEPNPEKRFKAKDLNHDGTITKEEFLHAQTTNFNRIDADKNGKISIGEMRNYMQKKRPKHVTPEQWDVKADHHFNRKDLNKDNVIAKDEFMIRYENDFKGYDRDGSNTISPEEMRIYWETEKANLEKAKEEKDD